MTTDCPDCIERREWQRRWDRNAVASIRRVLDCHVLGAEVIALKDAKYERLNALHALEQLSRIERRLDEAFRAAPTGREEEG